MDVIDIVGATDVVTQKVTPDNCVFQAIDMTSDGDIHYVDVVSIIMQVIGPDNDSLKKWNEENGVVNQDAKETPEAEEGAEEKKCLTIAIPPKEVDCVLDVNMDDAVSIEDTVLLLKGILFGSGEDGVQPEDGEELCLAPSIHMGMYIQQSVHNRLHASVRKAKASLANVTSIVCRLRSVPT